MKIPIDGIQAFVSVAELGSFNRAADKLSITQTALTRRIQRLEAFVGMKLLDRTTRSTALTQMGREFLPLAARLVEDLTYGLDRLRNVSRHALGDVKVATLQSVAFHHLPRALRIYARRHPRNRVEIIERSGAMVTALVQAGEADFGIHIQQSEIAELAEEPITSDPFVLVCSHEHPLANAGQLPWRGLLGVDFITLGGASGNKRIIEAQLAASGIETRGRFVVESTPTAVALASAGVAAAILPATMKAAAFASGLVEVALVEPTVHRTISIVRRKGETLTPAAESLLDIVRSEMKAIP